MKLQYKLVVLSAILLPASMTGCGDESSVHSCTLTEESCQAEGKTLDLENCSCVKKADPIDCTNNGCSEGVCIEGNCVRRDCGDVADGQKTCKDLKLFVCDDGSLVEANPGCSEDMICRDGDRACSNYKACDTISHGANGCLGGNIVSCHDGSTSVVEKCVDNNQFCAMNCDAGSAFCCKSPDPTDCQWNGGLVSKNSTVCDGNVLKTCSSTVDAQLDEGTDCTELDPSKPICDTNTCRAEKKCGTNGDIEPNAMVCNAAGTNKAKCSDGKLIDLTGNDACTARPNASSVCTFNNKAVCSDKCNTGFTDVKGACEAIKQCDTEKETYDSATNTCSCNTAKHWTGAAGSCTCDSGYVLVNGKCTAEGTDPVVECDPQSKDIDNDGKIDCLTRTIPLNALPELPEIEGNCGDWTYPKHHTIEYPDLPEFSYETTIDLAKYGISNTYDPDKATETSAALTKAIKEAKKAGFTRIRIPDGHYALKPFDGIHIPSNTALIMSENVILQMAPTDKTYCSLLNADGDSNIYIEGGTLIGDMQSKPNASGDQECGAFIFYNVHHVFINKMTIKEMRGDGIMILDYEPDAAAPTSHDFIIANSNIVDNYRNGIAVVGCDGIRISNNEIHHTHGADPQFGIDFEANGKSRANKRAIVDNNYFHDNVGGDIILDNYETFIEYNRFSQGDMELYKVNPFIPRGYSSYIMYKNTFEKFTKSTSCASKIGCTSHSEKDATSLNFFVENDIGNAQLQLKDRTNVCMKANTGKHISASKITNLRFIDNKAQQYSFSEVKGKASGNQRCTAEGACQSADDVNAMTSDKTFTL